MDKAHLAATIFMKSIDEAIGYLDLARMNRANGMDDSGMRKQAIKALQRFSDNDVLVDTLHDAEMAEMELEDEYGIIELEYDANLKGGLE